MWRQIIWRLDSAIWSVPTINYLHYVQIAQTHFIILEANCAERALSLLLHFFIMNGINLKIYYSNSAFVE